MGLGNDGNTTPKDLPQGAPQDGSQDFGAGPQDFRPQDFGAKASSPVVALLTKSLTPSPSLTIEALTPAPAALIESRTSARLAPAAMVTETAAELPAVKLVAPVGWVPS